MQMPPALWCRNAVLPCAEVVVAQILSDCELGTSASLPRVVRGAETRSRLEKRTLRRRFFEPAPPAGAISSRSVVR